MHQAALTLDVGAFKAEFARLKAMTSFQRALEQADKREWQRAATADRFWAHYERDAVGECHSSTEQAALAQIEVEARARTEPRQKDPAIPLDEIGMQDLMDVWREATLEHDREKRSKALATLPLRELHRWQQMRLDMVVPL